MSNSCLRKRLSTKLLDQSPVRLPTLRTFVQSHDMLYKTSRDILYIYALARPAREVMKWHFQDRHQPPPEDEIVGARKAKSWEISSCLVRPIATSTQRLHRKTKQLSDVRPF